MRGQFSLEDLKEVLRDGGVLNEYSFNQWTTFKAPSKSRIMRRICGMPSSSRHVRYMGEVMSGQKEMWVNFMAYNDGSGEKVTVIGKNLSPKIPMRKEVSALVAEEHGLEFGSGEIFSCPSAGINDLEIVREYISTINACREHLQRISDNLSSHIYALGDEGGEE